MILNMKRYRRLDIFNKMLVPGNTYTLDEIWNTCHERMEQRWVLREVGYKDVADAIGIEQLWKWCGDHSKRMMLEELGYQKVGDNIDLEDMWEWGSVNVRYEMQKVFGVNKLRKAGIDIE